MSNYEIVQLSSVIRLGQFLKFVNIAENGFHAKELIQNGDVQVNNAVETRRGLQLQDGDEIIVEDVMGNYAFKIQYI